MKTLNKIKKVFLVMGTFFITIKNKVYALNPLSSEFMEPDLYGPPRVETLYGIPATDKIVDLIVLLAKIIGILFIPLILILGMIAYVKKGKNSKVAKIFRIILIIAVISIILLFVGLCIYKIIS